MTAGRIHYLDGLRGILAIIVFAHHYLYAFCPQVLFGGSYDQFAGGSSTSALRLVAFTPINILFNPGAAIHFFFFLSGYVQTRPYFLKPDLGFVQKSFIKRHLRLALPTLAVLLLVFAFHRLHLVKKDLFPYDQLSSGWIQSMMPDNMSFLRVLRHGLVDAFIVNSHYYQVLWTMPTELFNSLMVLILLMLTHQVRNSTWLLLVWLVAQVFLINAYYSAAFTCGLLLARFETGSPRFNAIFSRPAVKYACLLVGLYFASYPYIGFKDSTRHTFYGLISFFENSPHIISYMIGDLLLFCFLLQAKGTQRFLSARGFRFFGDISFMFYLLHFLLLFSFSPWLYHQLLPYLSRNVNTLLTGLVSFAVITMASYLLYRWADMPVLKQCNAYTKKIFGVS